MATAVVQALAVRAAVAPGDPVRAEARDRLLAALLDDPARAVGAAAELADCQEHLGQLSAAVEDGRVRLADALGVLVRSGLTPAQLTRLSGLSDDEVAGLLAVRPA